MFNNYCNNIEENNNLLLLWKIKIKPYSLTNNEKFISTIYSEISIYKNKKANWIFISSENINYNKINPTKYKLNLKNISSFQDLSFLQSFHKECWNSI